MSRIRTIKPEVAQSESLGRLSRDARLLFILLWTIADDAGRARAASRLLASLLFPYDDDASSLIGEWLRELEKENCIRRYEIDGSQYLEITNWLKHQKIDRPSQSRLPPFDDASRDSAKPREDSRDFDADLGPGPGPRSRTVDQDQDHSTSAGADARTMADDPFELFKAAYPKRKGSQPWAPAKSKFKNACREGVDPEDIIAGAKRYAAEAKRDGKFGTEYVPMAKTWLNQRRWEDDGLSHGSSKRKIITIKVGSPQWDAWRSYYVDTKQRFYVDEMNLCATRDKAFPVPKEWPPFISIKIGSPQWNAWRSYYVDNGKPYRIEEMNRCANKDMPFPVPEAWPPNYRKAA